MKPADHDVREIRREDGVMIRLHFSSGGAALQEGMVCILEKLVDCLEKCLIYGHIRRFAN